MDKVQELRICSRCIYDSRLLNISFDEQGVCNYCRQVEKLTKEFGTRSAKGEQLLRQIIGEMKHEGRLDLELE